MLTPYSLIMAVTWFSCLGAMLVLARRRNPILFRYGLWPVLCLGVLLLVRVFFSLELPRTLVIGSDWLLVWLQRGFSHCFLGLSVGQWLILVWLAGAAVGISLFWFRWAKEMMRLSSLPKTRSPLMQQAARKATGKDLDIVISSQTKTPYVVGFFKPIVFLPDFQYDTQSLEMVFRHEYQHFLNRDQWKKALIQTVRLFLWWNPLAVLVRKELDQALEMLCDYWALKKLPAHRHGSYFRTILDLCRQANEEKKSAVSSLSVRMPKGLGYDSKTLLHQRITVGLALQNPRPLRHRIGTVLICMGLTAIFILSYTFVIQPQFPAPEMEDGYIIYNEKTENFFIVERDDGLYEIIVDNISTGTVDNISGAPYDSVPIISEKIWQEGKIS